MATSAISDLITQANAFGEKFVDAVKNLSAAVEQFRQTVLPSFIDLLEKYPNAMRAKIAMQRRLLRQGIVPSNALIDWDGEPSGASPEWVAEKYAEFFGKRGSPAFAKTMRDIGRVAALGLHQFTLRLIFPEVEAVARAHIYEPGTRFNITSLPSVRLMAGHILTGPIGRSLNMQSVDYFFFTLIDAVDFAYADDSKADQINLVKRHACIFRKVPNRHYICHGVETECGETQVVNAITVLYTVMLIAEVMSREGQLVAQQYSDSKRLLSEYKSKRRELNSAVLRMLYGNGGMEASATK